MALDLSTLFTGKITTGDPGYPFGKAKDTDTPLFNSDGSINPNATLNGTPINAAVLNDLFGLQQALLDAAGLTPSGQPDKVGESQYLDALNAIIASVAQGATSYLHIAYADSADGVTNFNFTSGDYMGTYSDNAAADSNDPADYTWVLVKGDPGPQGVPGTPAQTVYTWIRYADDASGTGISNSPSGKTHIGFAYNKTTASESNNPADYTWSLIQGPQGNTGVPGEPGADGQTTYTWIKYSANADGTGLTDLPQADTEYIGIAVNKTTASESSNKADYVWSKWRGDQGPQGVPGDPGADGQTTYTWIRYADDINGSGISNDPSGKTHIGFAYNKLTATESNNPADYTWALIQGPEGNQGVPGEPGADGQTTYTWIKYSANADGTGLTDLPQADTEYIGIAVNKTTASESSNKADYVWSKWRGDQGPQGVPGDPGADGQTTYTWIRYADDINGSGISNDPSGKTHIGFAYNKLTATESNNPADYTWALIQGPEGNQGVPGEPGADGQTTYTWIKYSANADGTGLTDLPQPDTVYIGIAVNKTTATESSNKADYVWSKWKGEDAAVNYATKELWTEGTGNAPGLYGGNFNLNGNSNENLREWRADPWGKPSLVWVASNNDTASGADGGWNKNINYDPNKSHISYVYFRRVSDSANGRFYFGCYNVNYLTGAENSNPYFWTGLIANLVKDEWYVAVGVIHSATSTNTTDSGIAGIYRLSDGAKIWDGTEFRARSTHTSTNHRTYLYYSTEPEDEIEWDAPGFYAINGSEPSLDYIVGKRGPTGAQGPQGVPGDPGADGQTTYTWIRYADDINGSGISNDPSGKTHIGFAYNKLTATESNNPADYTWALIQGPEGNQGVPGEPGADGQTTYTWIKYSPAADGTGLTDLPQADTEYIGIAVNKTTASESSNKADYVWSKWRGDQGPQGVPGDPGADGQTTYTWIRYADDINGSGISNDPSGKTHIGFAYNKLTATESNNPADYTWALIQGPEGNQGVPGEPGADGQTTYTWIKYSANADGTGLTDLPQPDTEYIGIAPNKNTATESTNKADYTWSKWRGDMGPQGPEGPQGPQGPEGPATNATTIQDSGSIGLIGGEWTIVAQISVPAGDWSIDVAGGGSGGHNSSFNMQIRALHGGTTIISDSHTSKYPNVSIDTTVPLTFSSTTTVKIEAYISGFGATANANGTVTATEVL